MNEKSNGESRLTTRVGGRFKLRTKVLQVGGVGVQIFLWEKTRDRTEGLTHWTDMSRVTPSGRGPMRTCDGRGRVGSRSVSLK